MVGAIDSSKLNWIELMKLKGTHENSSELNWAYETQWNSKEEPIEPGKGKNLAKRVKTIEDKYYANLPF